MQVPFMTDAMVNLNFSNLVGSTTIENVILAFWPYRNSKLLCASNSRKAKGISENAFGAHIHFRLLLL